jgi:hypothetical protein
MVNIIVESDAIKNVKRIYDELNLREMFDSYEKDAREKIMEKIKRAENLVPTGIFDTALSMISRRQK